MKAAHEVETGSDGEPITDTHAIECRTEFKQVTRVLRAEYNGMTHDYKMYFGSTDRLAKSPNVSDGEKVDIHLTRARYILDTVLSEEDDTEADDRAHLAAAQSVLQMVMEDSVSVADSADEPPTPNAHVIDIFSRKKRQ
jgi:hypothetical protein